MSASSKRMSKHLNSSFRSSSYNEEIEGNPWAVVPIKTRLYAKNTIEIELSNRKITQLVNFNQFENLQALWLNNNKLKKIEGLDKNFSLRQLYVSRNRLVTLEGSLSVMKFLLVLLIDNNKLRNLDKQLIFLKELPFIQNLNLFGNPLAEEPEYRFRVIFNIPSLLILDRHKITDLEKAKAEEIVPIYMNPLSTKNKSKSSARFKNSSINSNKKPSGSPSPEKSTLKSSNNRLVSTNLSSTQAGSTDLFGSSTSSNLKPLKLRRPIVHSQKILMTISKSHLKPALKDPDKNKKPYERLSITEKEMFIEANVIQKNKEAQKLLEKEKHRKQLKERELKYFDLPFNKAVEINNQRFLKDEANDCRELESNEIRRLFQLYDPSK